MSAFAVFDSLFDPEQPSFTERGVETLLALKSSDTENARMEQLAAKAHDGTLMPKERRDYEAWLQAGALISLLQTKARLYQQKLAECR